MVIAPRDDRVQLRAFVEDDLPFLDRLCTDVDALGQFEWEGFVDVRSRRKRWEKDGYLGAESAALAAELPDGTIAGFVSWHVGPRGTPGDQCREIGCTILPEHRGKGLGTAAQRLVVAHLFGYTRVERLEAWTDAENHAEQKALRRIGFQLEGVLRHSWFQHGTWRDLQVYALLRDEWETNTDNG
jgi:[ribosomal protein S5]-alanine N-acetyltransferase